MLDKFMHSEEIESLEHALKTGDYESYYSFQKEQYKQIFGKEKESKCP